MTANQRGRLFASRTTLSRSAYRVKSHGDRVLLTATSVNIPSTAVRQNARHRDIYGRATRHRSMCCRMRERAWREPGGMPMSDRRAQTGHEAARPQERGRAPAGRASSAAWCSIEGASYRRVNHPLLNSPSRQIPAEEHSDPNGTFADGCSRKTVLARADIRLSARPQDAADPPQQSRRLAPQESVRRSHLSKATIPAGARSRFLLIFEEPVDSAQVSAWSSRSLKTAQSRSEQRGGRFWCSGRAVEACTDGTTPRPGPGHEHWPPLTNGQARLRRARALDHGR